MTDKLATQLESALIEFVSDLRKRLAEYDCRGIDFSIAVSGRIHDGDLKIVFLLEDEYNYTGGDTARAKGGKLTPVIEEYLRRKKWNERHAPLCLPSVEGAKADDF